MRRETGFLYRYHREKYKENDKRNFRFFLLSQLFHSGMIFILLLGGGLLVFFALKIIF
jgi:hypothetical protein